MRTLKILNQKGMTLVEILIAAALMGGVALITAKLMGDQTNNQVYLTKVAEVSATISKIESLLNNPANCKAMLGGKTVSVAGTPIGTTAVVDTALMSLVSATGVTVNVLGEGISGSRVYTIPDNGVKLQRSIYGGSISDLVITFNLEGPSVTTKYKGQMIKRIPIVTQDNAGVITNCGPVLNDAESVGQKKMCDSLGGAAAWNGTKCVIQAHQCPYGQVVTRMNSLGDVVCEDLSSQVNLNELFDISTVNCIGKPNVKIINNGGKFQITCTP